MTPFELEIILHYYCSNTTPHHFWTPIGESTFRSLVSQGLLRENHGPGQRFYDTPKLHAFVEMLMATPLPVERWVDPRNQAIIKGWHTAPEVP